MINVKVISMQSHLHNLRWPNQICCRPIIGDFIASKDKGIRASIVEITHIEGRLNSYLELRVFERNPKL